MHFTKSFVALLSIILVFGTSADLFAKESAITQAGLESKFQALSAALNNRQEREAAILFLHNHIAPDATFKISTNNGTAPPSMQKMKATLDKASYINNHLHNTNFIDEYQLDIKINAVQIGEDGQSATSQETHIERGLVMNPQNFALPGKPFVNISTCETEHILQEGLILTKKSRCYTETRFETTI